MIPLFEANGHELTALNGKKSSFYQIIPSDIEGMTDEAKEVLFSEIEHNLVECDGECKLYWINNKLYINAFADIELSFGKTIPCIDPVESFLGTYSQNINFYENYLTSGDEFIRIFSIKDLPVGLNLLDTMNWPDYVLNFKKIDKLQAKSKINF